MENPMSTAWKIVPRHQHRAKDHEPQPSINRRTVTEIYDYMRLLFASIGKPHCHLCGRPITHQTLDQIVDSILDYPADTRVMILAPVVRGGRRVQEALREIYQEGYVRVRIDGRIYDLDEDIKLAKTRAHTVEVIVDRILIHSASAGDWKCP